MTEAADYFHDANLPRRCKDNIEQDLALNFQLSPFISVNRMRLECDFGRQSLDHSFGGLGFRLRSGHNIGVTKAALANRVPRSRNTGAFASSDAAAKAAAGNHSLTAVRPRGAVAGPRTIRHIKRARLCDRHRMAMRIPVGHAVRIAETTGLHLLRSRRHRRRRRASRREHIRFDWCPGYERLYVRQDLFFRSQRYFWRLLLWNRSF